MTQNEKSASAFIGRRIMARRQQKGVTAQEMAAKVGMSLSSYRRRELGLLPISLEFLLRCQLVSNMDSIKRLWFPVGIGIEAVDDHIIRVELGLYEHQERPVTLDQVLQITAEVFRIPVSALGGGFANRAVYQARTAATVVVASLPHLSIERLACKVRRTSGAVHHAYRKARRHADEAFFRKVELIHDGLGEL
ncbi:MAG: helix-turn-helix transcriptional regulator [Acidobacteriota bacterium]